MHFILLTNFFSDNTLGHRRCDAFNISYQNSIHFILAKAEVNKNEDSGEFKKNLNNSIQFYTEGMKVDCNNEELKARLYFNRATAYFYFGEKCVLVLPVRQIFFIYFRH